MTWWCESAKAQRTNGGMDCDTGRRLTSSSSPQRSCSDIPQLTEYLQRESLDFRERPFLKNPTKDCWFSSKLLSLITGFLKLVNDVWVSVWPLPSPLIADIPHASPWLCTICRTWTRDSMWYLVTSPSRCQWLSSHTSGSRDICVPDALCPPSEVCSEHQWKETLKSVT